MCPHSILARHAVGVMYCILLQTVRVAEWHITSKQDEIAVCQPAGRVACPSRFQVTQVSQPYRRQRRKTGSQNCQGRCALPKSAGSAEDEVRQRRDSRRRVREDKDCSGRLGAAGAAGRLSGPLKGLLQARAGTRSEACQKSTSWWRVSGTVECPEGRASATMAGAAGTVQPPAVRRATLYPTRWTGA